jgi:hypothetical protein
VSVCLCVCIYIYVCMYVCMYMKMFTGIATYSMQRISISGRFQEPDFEVRVFH